ncbi:hypothetical protein C451_19938 [Halococcus thailandensis JCM 13552]|uniref:Uncharacterized protein n=1 Tax=Halococcus thailandensis JCM 13552 TaxID=1227457 RepID=M0MST3_9EURY|nr:hypothetical protein C451_19938 [Halococcus thailandensis JCM 13552]
MLIMGLIMVLVRCGQTIYSKAVISNVRQIRANSAELSVMGKQAQNSGNQNQQECLDVDQGH